VQGVEVEDDTCCEGGTGLSRRETENAASLTSTEAQGQQEVTVRLKDTFLHTLSIYLRVYIYIYIYTLRYILLL